MSDLSKSLFLLKDQKVKLIFFSFLFLINASLELISLASIGVVLTYLFDSKNSLNIFQDISNSQIVLLIVIIFLARAFFIIFINYSLWHYCISYGAKLREKLMIRYQSISYERFTSLDPGVYSQRISEVVPQFAHTFLWSFLKVFSDAVLTLSISIYLAFINFNLFLISFGVALLLFIFFEITLKPRIKNYGKISNLHSAKLLSTVHNGISGLREIKLLNAKKYFSNAVYKYAKTYALANIKASTVQVAIKTIIEATIIIASIVFLILNIESFGTGNIIADLGVFVFGASRAIPSINQLILGINKMRYCSSSINILYEELHDMSSFKNEDNKNETSEKNKPYSISLLNLSVGYSETPHILENINLELKIGECLGIFGDSGSGKSSFLNTISGLIPHKEGELKYLSFDETEINLVNQNIYICPQEPFIIEGSIAKNISLSDHFEEDQVIESLKSSGFEFDKNLPLNHLTEVGVAGKKLSGGQRQRICIARAFYHNKDFLFFDEPTSSLDKATSEKIFENLSNLSSKKSITIVSHNLDLLKKYCNKIYKIENKSLIQFI
tara:strand:- start:520 stop:2190 length:1671 start_codon:yes stop_codon:yes gene_type:complete